MAAPVGEQINSQRFRKVLGNFCTGVTVIASCDGDVPVGFACQSFAALSLEPPLVLFCPAKTSRTWPIIERSGHFCVNVLADGQRAVSSVFGRGGPDKFAEMRWQAAPSGAPILDGVLTWIDCSVETVHDAGDHYIVIGRVHTLGDPGETGPLLFYRGAYGNLIPEAALEPGADLDELLTWPRHDDWI